MALVDVDRCPICGSTSFHQSVTCVDHTVTGELFHVKHCQQCTLGITSPRPQEHEAQRYYQSDTYISHSGKSKGIFDTIYLTVRSLTIRWKARLVRPYLGKHGILDVGCGTGSFLHHMQSLGTLVQGVEPSITASQTISNTIPVVQSIKLLPQTKYNVITLWHVLEHIYSLRETIQDLKARMAPGGALFLAVPNHESADATHYGPEWAAYDVPRHVWHFNRKSMAVLLQQEGLKITAILPMKLDAFYVCLLSERYRRKSSSSFGATVRAVLTALRSNRLAAQSGNYSSLIYVVQQ